MTEAIKGLPGIALLPARGYSMELVHDDLFIEIPKSGKYSDFDPEFFKDADDGEFDLLKTTAGGTIFLVPLLTRVLLAAHRYPALEEGELFVLTGIIFQEEKALIKGSIVRILPDEETEEGCSGSCDGCACH